jgi:dethiobiotin synthetase
MTAWFVTGTDTGVGKTRTSAALLHALRRRGLKAAGMKPVAAGTDEHGRNDDVTAMCEAAGLDVPYGLTNPYLLRDPVSPHIAARNAGVQIDIALLRERFLALRAQADAVVVEGAGGFLVPLSDTLTGADLAQALGLPVILVVGLRLGCLNHALLTQEAIAARGLRIAGWVANELDPQMRERAANLDFLRLRLAAPLLAHWPWDPPADAAALPIELPSIDA